MEKLWNCFNILHENGFRVRSVVCDNHSSIVSAYMKLLAHYGQNDKDLFINFKESKIYFHLIQNIRNNLLNNKRFIFPPFISQGLYDDVDVTGSEISWRMLHEVYERDENLQAHLKAAPKLASKVLHPESYKQSVPEVLAIFHPTTSAVIKNYFPDPDDAAELLNLINTWWIISNAKDQYNFSHSLGNATVINGQKPEFLRAMSNWVEKWEQEKIPNCAKFCLSTPTSNAL